MLVWHYEEIFPLGVGYVLPQYMQFLKENIHESSLLFQKMIAAMKRAQELQ